MKRVALLAALALAVASFAAPRFESTAKSTATPATLQNGTPVSAIDEINIDTVATYNFESGMQGWTVVNMTDVPGYWHRDTRRAYAGRSWACNDTITYPNGGYDNHTLNYFVSPSLNLATTTNPTLGFKVNVNCEAPAGATAPYTGWDCANVWYSINNGTTWTPLPIAAANGYAYNVTSAYSFGYEFGMGANIPGWGGSSNGWRTVSVPLTAAMRVSTFKFRFAFCSDPGWCSSDEPALFGMVVDSIRVADGTTTVLFNDADAAPVPSEFTGVNGGGAASPTNWLRATENTAGHSTPNCMKILEEPTAFHSALVSPRIYLAPGRRYYWQYNVWCNFLDAVTAGGTSLEDYYRVELRSTNPDSAWRYQHHDYNRTGAGGDGWTLYVPGTMFSNTANPNIQMDLTPWVGDTIQIRIIAIGDSDNNNGQGTGLFIDDVSILSTNQPDHDIAVANMDVPYPTTVNFVTRSSIHVLNLGRQSETDVQLRWRRNGQLWPTISLTNITSGLDTAVVLRTSSTGTGALGWVPTAAGKFVVDAYATVASDSNHANDTTNFFISGLGSSDTILVRAAGTYELGYDNRHIQYAFSFPAGSGPMVKFTPITDGLTGTQFALTGVRMQFNGGDIPTGQTRARTLKVYADNNGVPGTLLRSQAITVPRDSTLPNWFTANITGTQLTVGSSFFIYLENTATDTLRMIGHDDLNATLYRNGHFYTYNGTAVTDSNNSAYRMHAIVTPLTGVVETPSANVPAKFALHDAYPNPFNPTTEVKFTVPNRAHVTLALYNTMGQQVASLVNGELNAGTYTSTVRGENLASGVYLVKMNAGSFAATRKIVLVK